MRTGFNTKSSVFAGVFLTAMSVGIVGFALAADRFSELPLLLVASGFVLRR